MSPEKRAVVLLSGGLDSATCLAMAQAQGLVCYALTVRYGQRHEAELIAAERIAQRMAAREHLTLPLDLRPIGGSALTGTASVPKSRTDQEIAHGVPVTYVPARNTLLLSLALGWAEVLGATGIFIGVNALDYSGYPDCRPAFIEAFQALANVATRATTEGQRITLHAPLLHLTKAEIIRAGTQLGVDYSLTLSCYDPSPEGAPCRECDACHLRARGFEQATLPDPASQPR